MTIPQLAIILHASKYQSRRIAKRYCREFAGRANGTAAFLDGLLHSVSISGHAAEISRMADEIEARAKDLPSPDTAAMARRLRAAADVLDGIPQTLIPDETMEAMAATARDAADLLDDCRPRRRPLSDEILTGDKND